MHQFVSVVEISAGLAIGAVIFVAVLVFGYVVVMVVIRRLARATWRKDS